MPLPDVYTPSEGLFRVVANGLIPENTNTVDLRRRITFRWFGFNPNTNYRTTGPGEYQFDATTRGSGNCPPLQCAISREWFPENQIAYLADGRAVHHSLWYEQGED